jgi:hypothetical protein
MRTAKLHKEATMRYVDIEEGVRPRVCLSCGELFDAINSHSCPSCGSRSRAEPSIHPVFAMVPISSEHIEILKNSIATGSFWALLNEEVLEIDGDLEEDLGLDDSNDDPLDIA